VGTMTAPEIRELHLSARDRAVARDSFVREFERQWNSWSEIGRVAYEVERDKDFLLLGFKSFGAWIVDRAPKSRAYIYLVARAYGELRDDFTDADMAEIDLDSTRTLRQLSPAVRRDPEVREAAKKKPRELRQKVQEKFPSQHIEHIEERTLKFVVSQADIFDEAVQIWKTLNNPGAAEEDILEDILNDWMDSPVDDGAAYSRREASEQRKVLDNSY
jgi:hypothetical protein